MGTLSTDFQSLVAAVGAGALLMCWHAVAAGARKRHEGSVIAVRTASVVHAPINGTTRRPTEGSS